MTRFIFWPGILLLALVSGMTIIACNRGADLVGTWVNSEGLEKQFHKDGSWEIAINNIPNTKGTYTIDGNTITRKMTHLHGGVFDDLESIWYTEKELYAYIAKNNIYTYLALFPFERQTEIYTYSISGNTITFTYTGTDRDEAEVFTQIFTRK
jgi:galactose mutarotase-like enzyme